MSDLAAQIDAPTAAVVLPPAVPVRAAGVLYITEDERALFLKRGPGSDHPGEWAFPGGQIEGNETPIEAAMRESEEELGFKVDGDLVEWTRTITPPFFTGSPAEALAEGLPGIADGALSPVDFTTFLCRVGETFEPALNAEHVGYAWAPVDQPPEILHPGCRVALDRFTMNELDLARAIRDGRLTSPQKIHNVWLFALRVTGTGVAYRSALKEYAYRRPENYLTPDFLERIAGLSVIIDHPADTVMSSADFHRRIVGAVMMPYIAEDEVWAVCRIQDDEAAAALCATQLSTSPNVLLRGAGGTKVELADGTSILIEDDPSFVDHLAICPVGVWDKGGGPAGVISVQAGETAMADETEEKARKDAEEKARADAEEFKSRMDAFMSKADAVMSRMDAVEKMVADRKDADEEKARADAEEKARADAEKCEHGEVAKDCAKCDSARKDAAAKADAEKEAARADAARRDATFATRDEIKRLEGLIAKPMTDADFRAMGQIQARADSVMRLQGGEAPRPMQGETAISYRVRLADMLKTASPTYSKVELERTALADSEGAFKILENGIYEEAERAARNPATVPAGQLRAIVNRSDSGHTVIEYAGMPGVWMSDFMPQRQFVKEYKADVRGR